MRATAKAVPNTVTQVRVALQTSCTCSLKDCTTFLTEVTETPHLMKTTATTIINTSIVPVEVAQLAPTVLPINTLTLANVAPPFVPEQVRNCFFCFCTRSARFQVQKQSQLHMVKAYAVI